MGVLVMRSGAGGGGSVSHIERDEFVLSECSLGRGTLGKPSLSLSLSLSLPLFAVTSLAGRGPLGGRDFNGVTGRSFSLSSFTSWLFLECVPLDGRE
jgi:hypothetical protein